MLLHLTMCVSVKPGYFFSSKCQHILKPLKYHALSYLERTAFHKLAIFISIGMKGQNRGEVIGALTASFFDFQC
jgi:hypothetical protein